MVVIAVEIIDKGSGRVRLSIVPDASEVSLEKFITDNIEIGSVIITGGWARYSGLSEKGYNHKVQEMAKLLEDDEILSNVHRIASLLKR